MKCQQPFRKLDTCSFISTLCIFILVISLYSVFILPLLSNSFSIVFGILNLICISNLCLVYISNPGYIPLKLHPIIDSNNCQNESLPPIPLVSLRDQQSSLETLPVQYPFMVPSHNNPPTSSLVQTKVIHIRGVDLTCKYCSTCESWRPPRTYHCEMCGRCSFKHDHHCPWTGNCISFNNYIYFFNFVYCTTLALWFVFATTLYSLLMATSASSESPSEAISKYPTHLVLLIFTFPLACSLTSLSFYHGFLVLFNLTTHEHLKSKYTQYQGYEGVYRNPFDEGVIRNLYSVFVKRRNWSEVEFDYWSSIVEPCSPLSS